MIDSAARQGGLIGIADAVALVAREHKVEPGRLALLEASPRDVDGFPTQPMSYNEYWAIQDLDTVLFEASEGAMPEPAQLVVVDAAQRLEDLGFLLRGAWHLERECGS